MRAFALFLTANTANIGRNVRSVRYVRYGQIDQCMADERASPPRGWAAYPNLRLRPAAPSKNRGPVQVAVRRCLDIHGGVASSTQLYDFAHVRRRLRGQRLNQFMRWTVIRAVRRIADPDGLGRVRVSLPTYNGVETDWMGVVTAGLWWVFRKKQWI